MRNFVDEIVLALLCCLFSLLASKSEIAIVGCSPAVVLIRICAYANKPVRISAQILFCLCAIVVGNIFFYLPAVVYLALHERSWLVRLIWIAPLVGVMALNASGVTGSYGIGLQVQGSLIAEGLAAAGIADAFEVVVGVEVLLCASQSFLRCATCARRASAKHTVSLMTICAKAIFRSCRLLGKIPKRTMRPRG